LIIYGKFLDICARSVNFYKNQKITQMKKLITTMMAAAFAAFIYCNVNAQPCTPQAPTGNAGFTPRWQELPCVVNDGSAYDEVIYVENFDTAIIQSLRVDSIRGYPDGLSYVFDNNQTSRTFTRGDTACVRVTGSSTCAPGRYRLKVYATVTVLGQNLSNEACTLFGIFQPGAPCPLEYYINVKTPTGACDTSANRVDCAGNILGTSTMISIKELSIIPNPMQTASVLTFFSEESGTFDFQLRDLAGKAVRSEKVNAVNGNNRHEILRNNLPAGVYFAVLSKDGRALMQRITISD